MPRDGRSISDSFPAAPDPRAAGGVETVKLAPYYALEEPPKAEALTYRVVELPDGLAAARSAMDEREVRRILKEAKRELRQRRQAQPRPWPLEENEWQFLLYPFRVLGGILGLALIWVLFTPLLFLSMPTPENGGPAAWFGRLPLLVFLLTLLGVTWNFLRQVLRSGLEGSRVVPLVFQDFHAIAQSGFRALVAFLAGPIFLVAGALWFWVHAGALEGIDHLLLWQLGLGACVAWVFLLLAMDARDRLGDVQAVAVVRLIRRQGWPAVVFPLLGGSTLCLLVYLLIQTWFGFEEGGAWILQVPLWIGGLFLWTFLMRWYGMARLWREKKRVPGRVR